MWDYRLIGQLCRTNCSFAKHKRFRKQFTMHIFLSHGQIALQHYYSVVVVVVVVVDDDDDVVVGGVGGGGGLSIVGRLLLLLVLSLY